MWIKDRILAMRGMLSDISYFYKMLEEVKNTEKYILKKGRSEIEEYFFRKHYPHTAVAWDKEREKRKKEKNKENK